MNRTRTALPALALATAALALTLTGCAATDTPVDTTATGAVVVATETPVTETTVEPVETEAPEIVADEYSQVVGGVLYQGTAEAPVRIGGDVPGQAPAAEAPFLASGREGSMERAEATGKYVIYVFPGEGGWAWKLFGFNTHGTYREIGDSGYKGGTYFPSRDAAMAGPFTLDGRQLDRAEFMLWAEA